MRIGLLVIGALAIVAPRPAVPQGEPPPKLVVLISVDQMRADYLDRYSHRFEGGLKRLLSGGLRYGQAFHDHGLTATAPGHATIVTGVHPSRHGVVSNEWYDRDLGARIYAVSDPDSPILGFPIDPGRSPVRLLRTALGDWLKEASPSSRVYSVAGKDRSAVLMGGMRPNGVFWYQLNNGRFVTSTYYTTEYPAWVDQFNDDSPVDEYVQGSWDLLFPIESYTASRADSFPAEHDGVHVTFPHQIRREPAQTDPPVADDQLARGTWAELATTPFGDVVTFEFARRLVIEESLGEDETPDLLLIGASAGDFIGHRYGPYSVEMEDHYARLDRMLGDFLTFLDERVGADQFVTVLTSDHGVAMMPEEARARSIAANRIATSDIREELLGGITTGLEEQQIFAQPSLQLLYPLGLVIRFREEVSDDQLRGLRLAVAHALRPAAALADFFTLDELTDGTTPVRSFLRLVRNSFYSGRFADVHLVFRENDTFPADIRANHGSPYGYDRHVPLIFLEPGLAPREITREVRTVDIAPTIARILQLAPPPDLDGVALSEILRQHEDRKPQ